MDRHDRGLRGYEALLGAPPEQALADVRLRSPQLAFRLAAESSRTIKSTPSGNSFEQRGRHFDGGKQH
jgi:hypothetical protein